jgi:hypothetical protein
VFRIVAGGMLGSLLLAIRELETRLESLTSNLGALRAQRRPRLADAAAIRSDVLMLADSWRKVLAKDPTNARPIVMGLLIGRVTVTPTSERKVWELRGKGTLAGLFTGEICRQGIRPHRDSARCARAQRNARTWGLVPIRVER